jgi:hypothetical protein
MFACLFVFALMSILYLYERFVREEKLKQKKMICIIHMEEIF